MNLVYARITNQNLESTWYPNFCFQITSLLPGRHSVGSPPWNCPVGHSYRWRSNFPRPLKCRIQAPWILSTRSRKEHTFAYAMGVEQALIPNAAYLSEVSRHPTESRLVKVVVMDFIVPVLGGLLASIILMEGKCKSIGRSNWQNDMLIALSPFTYEGARCRAHKDVLSIVAGTVLEFLGRCHVIGPFLGNTVELNDKECR